MIPTLYEPFRKWSETGSVYIISDPHLEDEDCKFMSADWPEPQEYIDNLNSKIHKNDTLICLGDVGNPEWFSQIKAYKVLIMGNHDKGRTVYEPYFDEIYEGCLLIAPNIMLSHEPCCGLWWTNLHGHCHGEPHESEWGYNFSANAVKYKPISLGAMIKEGKIKNKTTIDIHRATIDAAILRRKINE